MDTSLIQIIIALIIVVLMGYISYNIYTIEFEKLLKGSNTLKKESTVFNGIVDFYSNSDLNSNTFDISADNYLDITPSTNQQGGAEYAYNFWLYLDKSNLSGTKDYVLLLKGNKDILINTDKPSFNCSSTKTIMIKNPLVRLSSSGDGIAVEYNNIVSIDSYQDVNKIKNCNDANTDMTNWKNKNGNLLGVYDLDFDKKWFMITIVMKEVSSPDNILFNNKASSKIYVNGVLISDKNVETKYNDKIYSATFKNNNAPLFVNPIFTSDLYASKPNKADIIKMADLKYFNYSLTDDEVTKIYNNGFTKSIYNPPLNTKKMVLSSRISGNTTIKDL